MVSSNISQCMRAISQVEMYNSAKISVIAWVSTVFTPALSCGLSCNCNLYPISNIQ